jgi:Protein of unknown function (DUF1214)
MYNENQAFAANPISRYAIGDRDRLQFNQDGSLDIYVQRASPGFRGRQGIELASRPGQRQLHHEHAPLLAKTRDSGWKLDAASGAQGELNFRPFFPSHGQDEPLGLKALSELGHSKSRSHPQRG